MIDDDDDRKMIDDTRMIKQLHDCYVFRLFADLVSNVNLEFFRFRMDSSNNFCLKAVNVGVQYREGGHRGHGLPLIFKNCGVKMRYIDKNILKSLWPWGLRPYTTILFSQLLFRSPKAHHICLLEQVFFHGA